MICKRCHTQKFLSTVHGKLELCNNCWQELGERWERSRNGEPEPETGFILYANGEIEERGGE